MPHEARSPKVFVSYSHDTPDHMERVLALGQRLITDGVDVVLDRLVFPPPSNWPLWMEDQMSRADFILVVCGEGYLKKARKKTKKGAGKGVKFESLLSYQQIYDNDSDSERFIPVLLEGGEYEHIPTPMRGGNHYKPESRAGDYEALLRHLTNQPEFIPPQRDPLKKLPPRTPQPLNKPSASAGGKMGVFMVPQERNPAFTGRDQLLKDLHSDLMEYGRQALRGLGGIGKTQIAVEYAYRHRDDYSAVLWTFAESVSSLVAGFALMAAKLGLPEAASQEQAVAIEAVKIWLQQVENQGWLLLLDNADRPDLVMPFLPLQPQGHILLTSRAAVFQTVGILHPREVDVLEPQEATEFLLKRTGKDGGGKSVEADALAKELGYLPLALEQAAAYIVKSGTSFKSYLASFKSQRLGLLNKQSPVLGNPQEKQKRTVATTWAVNFADLEKNSPASAQILHMSAFLAPDMIPLEILEKGGKELGEPLKARLAEAIEKPVILDELLQPLVDYSLVRRNPDTNSYSMHPLVQEVMREGISAEQDRVWADHVVRVVHAAFPDPGLFQNWLDCDRLLPHALACARLIDSHGLESEAAAVLLSHAAYYLSEGAHQYTRAEPLYRRAAEIYEKALGAEHPHTAISLNNLGWVSRSQGKYKEAEPLYRRAFEIFEKALGAEYPLAARTLNNLAGLYWCQGRYEESESLHRRALEILEKVLGPEHQHTATCLNNLALLYYSQGKYEEAERLYWRALKIYQNTPGADHPDTAVTLASLALLLDKQGKYDEAESMYRRAVCIAQKALTDDHPHTQLYIRNLTCFYRARGRVKDAEELERRLKPAEG
ncbi:MAG: tetratricopeptide repeat protein [Acidobacteriia bacterium]|nr:tetratricopeptide repeat protein [Terriglobia bacterium]